MLSIEHHFVDLTVFVVCDVGNVTFQRSKIYPSTLIELFLGWDKMWPRLDTWAAMTSQRSEVLSEHREVTCCTLCGTKLSSLWSSTHAYVKPLWYLPLFYTILLIHRSPCISLRGLENDRSLSSHGNNQTSEEDQFYSSLITLWRAANRQQSHNLTVSW